MDDYRCENNAADGMFRSETFRNVAVFVVFRNVSCGWLVFLLPQRVFLCMCVKNRNMNKFLTGGTFHAIYENKNELKRSTTLR